jgi:hypothetical protein
MWSIRHKHQPLSPTLTLRSALVGRGAAVRALLELLPMAAAAQQPSGTTAPFARAGQMQKMGAFVPTAAIAGCLLLGSEAEPSSVWLGSVSAEASGGRTARFSVVPARKRTICFRPQSGHRLAFSSAGYRPHSNWLYVNARGKMPPIWSGLKTLKWFRHRRYGLTECRRICE